MRISGQIDDSSDGQDVSDAVEDSFTLHHDHDLKMVSRFRLLQSVAGLAIGLLPPNSQASGGMEHL